MKPKGVRVVTELSEKEVMFLTDVDAMFVSLVKHAANQQPFRVIKAEDEEIEKGGPGSGSWEGPGDPRFAWSGDKELPKGGVEIYHGTAADFAESILSEGLLVSKGQKGMTSGVYGSLNKVDAFYHASVAATKVAQRMIQQEGKPQKEVLKNLKVMMITANKADFPYKVYEGAEFYRSKVDIPPKSFYKVEVFKFLDVEKYNKKVSDVKAEGGDIRSVPLPKSLKVRKADDGDLFLSFVFLATDEEAEKGGEGSGSWDGPGQPRFAREESKKIIERWGTTGKKPSPGEMRSLVDAGLAKVVTDTMGSTYVLTEEGHAMHLDAQRRQAALQAAAGARYPKAKPRAKLTLDSAYTLFQNRGMQLDLSEGTERSPRQENGQTTYSVTDKHGNTKRMNAKEIHQFLQTDDDTFKTMKEAFLTDGDIDRIVDLVIKGGEGSGNWGHLGRAATHEKGGSAPSTQAQTAFSAFMRNEGASISMRGNPPHTGYMISPYKGRETRIRLPKDRTTIDRAALVARFKKFREDNKDVLKKKGHYFGAWVSKGILYLDVSVNESDIGVAKRLAKRHNQLALWDVKNSKEVKV